MTKKKKTIVRWIPVYVSGRPGFADKITEALTHSGLPFMPGYYHDSNAAIDHTLIWTDENTMLKQYKAAIGARTIWKYRLRFFRNLQEFTEFIRPRMKEESEEELETAA